MAYERVQRSANYTSSQKKQSRIVPPPIDIQTQADSLPSTGLTGFSLPSKAERDAIRRSLFEKWAGTGKLQAKAEAPQPESESEVVASAETSTEIEANQHQEASESLSTMGLPIQAKLTIGTPGDKYEQEADQVAAQVVNQINAPAPQQSGQSQSVQREAIPEEEDELMMKPEISTIQREEVLEEEEELQMKPMVQLQPGEGGMTAPPEVEASIQQARGGGQPLANNIRGSMEQAFGADFSGVKVHTDTQADQLNQSIQARAFTTGQNVFFRQGEYNPGSRGGQELIAHELTHVVQQSGGGVQPLIQRRVVITPEAYANGLGVKTVNLTKEQLAEYIAIAVWDDFQRALNFEKNEEILKKLNNEYKQIIKVTEISRKIEHIKALINEVNEINSVENRDTRYATEPPPGYKHTSLTKRSKGKPEQEARKWGNDEEMWKHFGKEIGEKFEAKKPQEIHPRTKKPTGQTEDNLPLKQLPWDLAKAILPRPLINLIFDVRFQLERTEENAEPIDERTKGQKTGKDVTPNEPGTLRSWHQDTHGVLPKNDYDAKDAKQEVPEYAMRLHAHYRENSEPGHGTSTRGQEVITTPIGYAEYTGTGSNSEHNTKIVLDYIKKKVYLTLTHYQYWVLIKHNGNWRMVNCRDQTLAGAQANLPKLLEQANIEKNENEKQIWMSPWVEILTPGS